MRTRCEGRTQDVRNFRSHKLCQNDGLDLSYLHDDSTVEEEQSEGVSEISGPARVRSGEQDDSTHTLVLSRGASAPGAGVGKERGAGAARAKPDSSRSEIQDAGVFILRSKERKGGKRTKERRKGRGEV